MDGDLPVSRAENLSSSSFISWLKYQKKLFPSFMILTFSLSIVPPNCGQIEFGGIKQVLTEENGNSPAIGNVLRSNHMEIYRVSQSADDNRGGEALHGLFLHSVKGRSMGVINQSLLRSR